jgi:hypothetical protein
MFRKWFASEEEDFKRQAESERARKKVDPRKLPPDLKALDWIVSLLHDFGLSRRAMIDAVDSNPDINLDFVGEFSEDEQAALYLCELYRRDHPSEENLSGLPAARYSVVREVLAFSRFGLDGTRPHADDRMLRENLQPALAVYDLEMDFSPHAAGGDFTIRVGKGDRVRKKDYHASRAGPDLAGKVEVINALLAEHELRYYKIEKGNVVLGYYLVSNSRLQALREKYGPVIDRILSG